MKFFHISDLHLGKNLNGFSMIDVQNEILNKIVAMAVEYKPDCLIIAGDVYDKTIPTIEGIQLLDKFLNNLCELKIKVFIITGNHDSVERVGFASDLLKSSNIYIAKSYQGEITPICLHDEFGELKVWMLPYIKPANVRRYFDYEISTCSDAVSAVFSKLQIKLSDRNIFIGHQYLTGASRCEIDSIIDENKEFIDPKLFNIFDYVALGDNHQAQFIGRETIRYSGSPLKYSFLEVNNKKSLTLMEIKSKRCVSIKTLPLVPSCDLREIKGYYKDIMKLDNYKETNTNDYVRIILKDENDISDAISKIRTVYPNIMRLEYSNRKSSRIQNTDEAKPIIKRTPTQHFEDLFESQIGHSMSDEQLQYVKNLFNEILKGVVVE
ncbi:MAG: exonuclease SbcCD subunit D [Christensenellaceae bacterium]|jgi:exonuclease SbcD|nr:exonuclease SbcCD subunit D [Christensenellaceae bacterium]